MSCSAFQIEAQVKFIDKKLINGVPTLYVGRHRNYDKRNNNNGANDENLNSINSHGGEAQPRVDAVEVRDRVRLPVFVLPLLIIVVIIDGVGGGDR